MASDESAAAPLRPTIAVVGSGPSGCYTAQFLRKDLPEAEITIFEALPVPYGLVRYGVAADHQGTKAVAAQFDRMFVRSDITFVGNTSIGIDIAPEAITDAFDVVVVATGLTRDRRLSVPQDENARVIGAGRIIRSLNAFPAAAAPAAAALTEPLGSELIVVGHGNVAIDVVRLLTKPDSLLTGSDIDDDALKLLRPQPPTAVHVIGRSAADAAKFDLAMLRELCTLKNLRIDVEGLDSTATGPVADLLRQTVCAYRGDTTTAVTLHFQTVPAAVRVEGARTVLDVLGPTGTPSSYAGDTVITAIGFCHDGDDCGDASPSWVGEHVYRVGWLERGGRGNIAENRKHAQRAAKTIVDDLATGRLQGGRRRGLTTVLPELRHWTGFDGWQAIDDSERRDAGPRRCRRKITNLEDMLAIAHRNHDVTDDA
ncbi:FAD-dependent oxidoreductase [Mycolicibacterium sp. P9-64]|uniref:FAD-dependent oxidoreductase n=1 Tax=Mycolicibacterium sp. P9-64 TaxID=2024612 RepID=UPI0015633DCF|nr:FAD-dependent oxidoreductase [Mycolicibacterium sp. P9-64]